MRWPLIAGHLLREIGRVFARGASGRGARHRRLRLRARSSGGRRGTASRPRSRSRTPIRASRRDCLSRRVRHVYLGLPEARSLLRFGAQTRGVRHRQPDRAARSPERRASALARFGLDGSRPVVLVTGGSQGALAINRAVAGWLDAGWPAGVDLLWVTGRGTLRRVRRTPSPAGRAGHRLSRSRWPMATRWPTWSSRGRA